MAKAPPKSAEMKFLEAALRINPRAEYADLREAAKKKGLKLYPILYGKAKVNVGLIRAVPWGMKKHQREADVSGRDPSPRPSKGSVDLMEQFRAALAEKERLREAIDAIRAIVNRLG